MDGVSAFLFEIISNISLALRYFDKDPVKSYYYNISRTVAGKQFEVKIGDFVEIYYDAFDDSEAASEYNSILKILSFGKDNRKHAFASGRFYRYSF